MHMHTTKFTGHLCTFEHKIEHKYDSPPINVFHYDSMIEGPHLLILSGIHAGTERIPSAATKTLMDMLDSAMLNLSRGELTIIPMCNPLALKKDERFVDVNLNRVMQKHDNPSAYEHHLANVITGYIDRADAVLDLHTQSTPTIPFVFDDFPEVSADLAKNLGIKNILRGWVEAFENNDALFNESDTSRYSCEQGKPSVCVECGYNKDPMAASIALRAIINAMHYYGLTDNVYQTPRTHRYIEIQEGVNMPENGKLAHPYHNFHEVKKGEALILSKTDETPLVMAPYDCMLLLPKIWATPGVEAFFYGIEK